MLGAFATSSEQVGHLLQLYIVAFQILTEPILKVALSFLYTIHQSLVNVMIVNLYMNTYLCLSVIYFHTNINNDLMILTGGCRSVLSSQRPYFQLSVRSMSGSCPSLNGADICLEVY